MKTNLQIVSILLIIFQTTVQSLAQAPLVKVWDKRFGGTDEDWIFTFQQTSDKGFILGGYSRSGANGDRTQINWDTDTGYNHPTTDYWVVKIDSLGNKQWDQRYGGSNFDNLVSIAQTKDGGYAFGGVSASGIGGDKFQTNWDFTEGTMDYWVVKTDSEGNLQWERRYGGTGDDWLRSLQQTADGGYILAGFTHSGVSADRSQPIWGLDDYWVIKVDSVGNKQWDKRYGGNQFDQLYALLQTPDGGYLLGGYSNSGVNGDRTQPNWGSGASDYWIVKIDSVGNKLWDRRYGGINGENLSSMEKTPDGGYILGGWSYSGIGGDKTQSKWDSTRGTADYWVIKIDSAGNKQWDRRFGGMDDDRLYSLQYTEDGGYLLGGTSFSPAGGEKSEDGLSAGQPWIVKTDSVGNKLWDKTILYPGVSILSYASQIEDVCYAIINLSRGGIGGDRTQPNWDTTDLTADYWIVKFCDTTSFQSCNSLDVTTDSFTVHVTCLGASDGAAKIDASGGTPPYSFLWSNGQTTSTPTNLPAGTYSVTVTDNNGCKDSTSITIAEGPICTGVRENILNSISLYPNPTEGSVTLQMPSLQGMASLELKLYDALGRQLLEQNVEGAMIQRGITLDLKNFPGNIFFLNITTEAGSRMMKVMKY